MTEFLAELVSLTLGGSAAVALLALTARLSRRRYAARWRCWLWLLLSLRLVIPVPIALPEQTQHRAPIQITAPVDTVIYSYGPDTEVEFPVMQQPATPEEPQPEQPIPTEPAANLTPVPVPEGEPEGEITLYQILFGLWAAGAAVVLLWYMISHLRFLRWVRRWGTPAVNAQTIRLFNALGDELELNRRPGLLVCAGLRVPILAGVFVPRLLLPEGEMGENALRYSLLHELTHFKRRDIWLKSLALLVNAVHWFNPLMWYMTRLVERDTELACDEAALKRLPAEEHSAYGTTILDAVARMNAPE